MSNSERLRSQTRSSHSTRLDVSDVESTSGDRDYRQIAKKLAKDKSVLKDKLRLLLDEVEARAKDHHKELDKTQRYFQTQIDELTDERDRLGSDVHHLRALLIEEKDKAREQYEQKLQSQKELLEKRYGYSNGIPGAPNTIIKRLEDTIGALQDKLNKQIDTTESIKNTAEEYLAQREQELMKKNLDLDEQFQKLKEIYNAEHNQLLQLTKAHKDEIDALNLKFSREKQEELNKHISEKSDLQLNTNLVKETLEKKNKLIEQQKDEQITAYKFELDKFRVDSERRINEITEGARKTIEELKKDYEGKLFEKDRSHRVEVDTLKKDFDKNMNAIVDEDKRQLTCVVNTSKKELDELKKVNKKLQTELESVTQKALKDVAKKEEELKTKYDQSANRSSIELSAKLEAKEKELADHKLRSDKMLGELEDTNDVLKSQLIQVQTLLKKVQDNSQNMNNQFINNLNKQKDLAEEEINRRDTTISIIERQLKKTADESLDRINSLDRKLKNAVDETKELTEKLNSTKLALEQKNSAYDAIKGDLSRTKENCDKLVEKIKQLDLERETAVRKVQLEKEAQEKRISVMDATNKNRDQEFTKYKEDSIRLAKLEANFKEEVSKSAKTVEKISSELETKSAQLDELQHKFTELQTTAHQLMMKNKDLDTDLSKKNSELRVYKNEIEIANRNANNSFTEMTKFRNNMTEEVKLKLGDKDRQIADLARKIAQQEQALKLTEQNRDQLLNKLNSAIAERDSSKQLLETFSGPNSEYKLKTREVDKLREDIEVMKKNFANTIANLNNEFKAKEDGHKAEIARLNAKIHVHEMQAVHTEQRIEKLKLEFLKEINETKKLPPDDHDKMVRALKERDEYASQLALESKKLDKLQAEYAEKTADIKIKTKWLEEKEKELKSAEEIMKNAPPKILDPQLRKARDEALNNLRAVKLELGKLKEESMQSLQKLEVAERLVKEQEREKNLILKAQSEMKETLVNNLNQQQAKHEKELLEKTNRIRELESILTEKVKN